ncbi:Eco57I restriction-modification methylase domain-containing protein [Aequorivita sinensis]|uniref:Eco57I restriction-modification methylase domain-containing protein n=1 Tax=Aequorivita sinensis TaxID=1382458 RepID=UPI002301130F|nr:DNA methyltransferase [Aequorivita sinensis]
MIEDRKLIYPEKLDSDAVQKQEIYYNYYSLQRLTNLAENLIYVDPKKTDLWSSLLTTFSLFEYKENGQKLGIAPLGSGLFHPSSLGKLREQSLDNETLLGVLRYLVSFENENKQRVRVNYADLDVEEFGSVYEGLLEYEPKFEVSLGAPIFTFVEGDERSSSGSHYTPEELVKPLIDHSLQYQIEEKLKEADPEKGLLSLTVCDVACGSGHILLSAARRIGFELAKVRSGEDQPTPSLLRTAVRDVINNCIYGVDLNPLAVELCKVALWLEAHQPGEPLNFLDHHIKCGNAIVGLAHFEELKNGIATEAFKTLPGDDKDVAATFRKANEDQRKTKGQLSLHDLEQVESSIKDMQQDFAKFLALPEHTPQQIEAKTKVYESLTSGKKWFRIKQLADLQVAQFFIAKTDENREKLTTEAKYQNYLNTGAQIQDRGAASAMAAEKRIFHWFLEFPQVFRNGGFDCILGNPPFLGASKISGSYGDNFLNYLHFQFAPTKGWCDLVGYFFRRNFVLISDKGYFSLISTNSISQGDTRKGSLDLITQNKGEIIFAKKTTPWPGAANVDVSLVSIYKGLFSGQRYIGDSKVIFISNQLDDQIFSGKPIKLESNKDMVHKGYEANGMGFVLTPKEAHTLLKIDSRYEKVIRPYMDGRDVASNLIIEASRFIIYFDEMTENEASEFEHPFGIVKEKVKPERLLKDKNKYPRLVNEWWKFWMNKKELSKKLMELNEVYVIPRVGKYQFFQRSATNNIFHEKVIVVTVSNLNIFAQLNSLIHIEWIWKYSSTLGSGTLNYSPSDVFETFPFSKSNSLESFGKEYDNIRQEIKTKNRIGLTKLYNQFNDISIKTQDIERLRQAQRNLDYSIIQSYGWENIELNHDFYTLDYLPENDRVRYTIHPAARKEVLKRLLLLNHERFEEEAAKGLHKRKDVEAYFKQKGKEIPEEIAAHFSKKKGKTSTKPKTKEKEAKEFDLFTKETPQTMKAFSEHDGIYSINDAAAIINKSNDRVRRWFKELSKINYEGLDDKGQTDIDKCEISFLGLIELVVIGELIDNGFKIRKIFKARESLAEITGLIYPFATDRVEKSLKLVGDNITWDFEKGNVTLNGKNQFNIGFIREFFNDIIFKNGLAKSILPSRGNKRVEITPKVAGGKPAIINSNGIEVETILRHYNGQDSIDDLISDYGVSKEDINAALAYQS